MTDGVPLVIPEVNPEAMAHMKVGGKAGIIANPNCSTIIALMAVTPIHRGGRRTHGRVGVPGGIRRARTRHEGIGATNERSGERW